MQTHGVSYTFSNLTAAQYEIWQKLKENSQWTLVLPRDWPLVLETAVSRGSGRLLLASMADQGVLKRLRRGAYLVMSADGDFPADPYALLREITTDPTALLSGKASLKWHGWMQGNQDDFLILQISSQRSFEANGWRVHFARMNEPGIWGQDKIKAQSSTEGMPVSIPQRALLDAMQWGEIDPDEIVSVLKRGYLLEGEDFLPNLYQAIKRYNNQSHARRIGFLLENKCDIKLPANWMDLRGESHASILLNTAGDQSGEVDSKWRVLNNI